jgi:hypothetical protein
LFFKPTEEQSKDIEDIRAASGGSRGKETSATPVASSPRKRTTPPLLDDYEGASQLIQNLTVPGIFAASVFLLKSSFVLRKRG